MSIIWLFIGEFLKEKLSNFDDHHGKIQTRDREMSADPGPHNTFLVGFQNYYIFHLSAL